MIVFPRIGNECLVPDQLFVARWPRGRHGRYRYTGTTGTDRAHGNYVNAKDMRGNARSIPLAAITKVIRLKKGTAK
jgi:hypothetical protein